MSNYRRRMMQKQEDEVVDLSLQDIYGNPINRSTANCYVVSKPGKYRFPLVYGNAIKNGRVNTAAFTNNGGSFSHDFVNSMGSVITQPYITVYGDHELEVINSDCESSVISNLMFDENREYACFDINEIPLEGGNILIRLKPWSVSYDESWSWHIWLWPHDLTPVEITNSTGVKYNIMPVNLASKYDSDGVHIKNWFYQWGRKDPMLLPSARDSVTDHSPGSITKVKKTSSLASGIVYPTRFFYNSSSPCNWFGDKSYYNLWDASCFGTGNSDNDTVKTVYDPCPVGWKVPNGNVFTGFSSANVVGSFANGYKFKRYSGDTVGVFFPALGSRTASNGSLNSVGSLGYVWLSSAHSKDYAYSLGFRSGLANPKANNYRAFGFSVRPVQDDNTQLDVIMISFKIRDTTYQAKRGMTWGVWCQSSYNTGGYYIGEYLRVTNSEHYVVDEAGSTYFASSNDIIRGDYTYITEIIYD